MLKEKQVPHQTTYVNASQLPDWLPRFAGRPPLPLLKVENNFLLDPQAICEYLEEAHPAPALMPDDLLARARARSWFRYADSVLFPGLQALQMASAHDSFQQQRDGLRRGLEALEAEMGNRTWLTGDGERFGMADVAVAPFFTRTSLLKAWFNLDLLREHPHVSAWGERLLARASVRQSVPADFQDSMLAQIQAGAGFLTTLS